MGQHQVPKSLAQDLIVSAKEGVIWGPIPGALKQSLMGKDISFRLTQKDPYTLIDYAQTLTRRERPPDTRLNHTEFQIPDWPRDNLSPDWLEEKPSSRP